MEQGRCTAIVLAAGQGKRMHSKIQKQFLEIGGKPVLYYSLHCFQESPLIQDIILVAGEESISYCKEEIVQKYGCPLNDNSVGKRILCLLNYKMLQKYLITDL